MVRTMDSIRGRGISFTRKVFCRVILCVPYSASDFILWAWLVRKYGGRQRGGFDGCPDPDSQMDYLVATVSGVSRQAVNENPVHAHLFRKGKANEKGNNACNRIDGLSAGLC